MRGVLVRGMRREDLASTHDRFENAVRRARSRISTAATRSSSAAGLPSVCGSCPAAQITLIAPRGNVTPFGVTPRVKSYTVAGTFSIGMSEYDQTFVFMPLDEAQLYFNMGNNVSGLEVMVSDPDSVNRLLSRRSHAPPGRSRASSPGRT